jgi:type II secretion system protein J
MRIATPRTRAFTLIEVLVATAMFAVLIGALCVFFYGALQLRDTTHADIDRGLPGDYALQLLRGDLAACLPPVGLLAGEFFGERIEEGTARRDTLTLHTASGTLDEDDPWGDIQCVEYELEEPENDNEEGLVLVRLVTRNLLASTEEDPTTEKLLPGVEALEFSYYDGEEWEDSWDSTTEDNALPMAVRVRIEFAEDADGHVALPLEVVVPFEIQPRDTGEDEEEGEGEDRA